MSATTTHAIYIISCPACGNPIELHATYDVRLDLDADTSAFDRTVTATLMMTGARVNHECPPPKPLSFFTEGGNPLARGGVVTTHNPVIRED